MRGRLLAVLLAVVLMAVPLAVPAGVSAQAGPPEAARPFGSFALSGDAARDFVLPEDVVEVRSWGTSTGRSATRYQQVVADATVFGSQITVIRDAGGTALSVIGAHFPGLQAKGSVSVSRSQARATVEREIGPGGQWRTQLRLDPATASRFYEVQSLRDDSRPVRWVDTERDFDYVYVKDDDGNVLATYTGRSRRAVTSPCIPTSTGSVQLVTDPAVVAQGFIVDAVVPC